MSQNHQARVNEKVVEPELFFFRRALFLINFVALLARLAYFYELSGKPYFGVPLLDSRWWYAAAQQWAREGTFPAGSLFRPPLYTVFLGILYKFSGEASLILAPVVQLLLGSVFCVLIAVLAAHCWDIPAGIAAGLLAALYAPLVFFEAEVLNDTLFLFFLTAFLLAFVRAVQDGSFRAAGLAGVLSGCAAITRPNAILVCGGMFLVGAFALWRRYRNALPLAWFLIVLGPFVFLIALPTLHNVRAGDPALVCTQGGVNFWLGNNPDANGTNVIIPKLTEQGNEYRDTVEEFATLGYLVDCYGVEQGLRRFAAGEPTPPLAELSLYWFKKGFRFLWENPRAASKLYFRKFVALFNNHEVRNNRDFGFARTNESMVLRILPVNFAILLAFAVNALSPGLLRKPAKWVALYFGLAAFSILLFFVAGRLRLPLLPAMLVFAGIGLERFGTNLWRRRWSDLAKSAVIMFIVGILSCYQWPQLDYRTSQDQLLGRGILATSYPAGEWALLAIASLEKGRAAEALEYAQRAVATDSTFAHGYLVLGNAALATGDLATAAHAYRQAIANDPRALRAYNNLAVTCERLGLYQEAAELYLHVLRQNPADVRASANLAMLLMRSGDRLAARTFASQAFEGDPSDRVARAVLARGGQLDKAGDPRDFATLMAELDQPLPVRIDLTSSRPLTQIFDILTSASAQADLLNIKLGDR